MLAPNDLSYDPKTSIINSNSLTIKINFAYVYNVYVSMLAHTELSKKH